MKKSELRQIIKEVYQESLNKKKITGYFVFLGDNEFSVEGVYDYNKDGEFKEIKSFSFNPDSSEEFEKAKKQAIELTKKLNAKIKEEIMKISELKQIIKEEISLVLNENSSRMKLKDLIKILQDKNKKGVKFVDIDGTIMLPDDGNFIVWSNKRQM